MNNPCFQRITDALAILDKYDVERISVDDGLMFVELKLGQHPSDTDLNHLKELHVRHHRKCFEIIIESFLADACFKHAV